jgi:hypothetical protein
MNWVRLGAAAAIALIAGAGVMFATIPDASGVIHGCYTKSTGLIRIIDDSVTSCRSGDTAISWNIQGAPGPKGDTGNTGPAGAPGPANVLTDILSINTANTPGTESLTVPGFGTVDLSCSDHGIGNVSITGTAAFDGTYSAGTRFTASSGGATLNLDSITTPGGTIWVDNATGHWKIDYLAAPFQPGIPPNLALPCTAAAVVTVF